MNQQQPPVANDGLDPKLAGLLAYLIPPVTGIVFFLLEKENRIVRWHAAQSIVFGVAWIILWVAVTILSLIPFVGWIAGAILSILLFVVGCILWVVCLVKGYSGQMWRMPLLAQYADQVMGTGGATTA